MWMAAIGSGELTGQSLPITSRTPLRFRSPNGYCHAERCRPERRQRQFGNLRVATCPQRLRVGCDAEPGEPWHVFGMNHLEGGYIMP
jgi:hypothetical protein